MSNKDRGVVLLSHGFQAEYECGFANGLSRNGLDVTLIGSDVTLTNRLDPKIRFLNFRGSQAPNRPFLVKAANLIVYWLRYSAYLLKHRGSTVHVFGLFSLPNLFASLCEAWLTKMVSGGYILTVHNLMPHDRHNKVNAALSRIIYKSAKACIVHTQRMKDELAAVYSINPASIFILEHGIDRLYPRDNATRVNTRARIGLSMDDKTLLFFGQIAPYKGLDLLLMAYDHVIKQYKVKLIIAGYCRDGSYREWLKAEIDSRNDNGSILWMDCFVPDEDVVPLFIASDIFVMPYKHIDQSGVLFMALSTGLPLVVTDVGSLKDYISPGSIAVPPNSPYEFSAAIIELLGSMNKLNSETHNNLKKLLWINTVKSLLPLYRNNG